MAIFFFGLGHCGGFSINHFSQGLKQNSQQSAWLFFERNTGNFSAKFSPCFRP
jgi:hypothetical protein